MKDRYIYLCSGAIGEALLGIHIGRVLEANVPNAKLKIILPRPNPFVRQLVAELPFVEYVELPKERLSGWIGLISLVMRPYRSVVLETVTVDLPLWWQLILWCARARRGSIQVRYQMIGHERYVPEGVKRLSYDCPTQNYFDTPPSVLNLWGILVHEIPLPTLPIPAVPKDSPYILFHFFAGNYKRSIPVDHARAILIEARKKFPRHQLVLTCMDSEKGRAELMRERIDGVRLESGLSAPAVLELISGADLVVGTASGILLVAAHLSAPVIAMSCLSDPCWLPTFSPTVTIIAARDECLCNGNKTAECVEHTPEGYVFRCLFFIKTADIVTAMENRLPA